MMVSLSLSPSKSISSFNPIPRGCVLYLPLWNPGLYGTTFKSVDPFGHVCTRVGGVMGSYGVTMDGDDYISQATLLDVTPTAITLIVWFKRNGIPADYIAILDKNNIRVQDRLDLYIDPVTGFLSFYTEQANAGQKGAVGNVNVTDNASHFAACVWDTTNGMTLYLDGASHATNAGETTLMRNGSESDFLIGAQQTGISKDRYYTGDIAEVWVYNRALSATEITYIYNQTKGRYL